MDHKTIPSLHTSPLYHAMQAIATDYIKKYDPGQSGMTLGNQYTNTIWPA